MVQRTPLWLQDAARRQFQNGNVSSDDITELVILCKKEVGIAVEDPKGQLAQPVPAEAFTVPEATVLLRLDAMAELKGINALVPRKPLKFGPGPLTVIYGSSGSGKSGYMRVLKHICGARETGSLLGNVFEALTQEKSCKVSYTVGTKEREIQWTPVAGIHSELRRVSLYDTGCAHVYVNNENEVAYEPPLLTLFRLLVDVCEQVDQLITAEIAAKVSSKPQLPTEYLATVSGIWFNALNRLTTEAEIETRCTWSEQLGQELTALNRRLTEANPTEKAKALRKTIGHLIDLAELFKSIEKELNDESFSSLLQAKADAKAKRQVADIDAKKVFENAPLSGIASETWRLLWEQARVYSETEAYTQMPFPNLGEQARCVLCQQPLRDEEAKSRIRAFEAFVKGNLELEAARAESRVKTLLTEKKEIPSGEELAAKLDLGGVSEETTRETVRSHCELLRNRKESFLIANDSAQLQPLPEGAALTKLAELESNFEEQAKAFEEDAKTDRKKELQQKVRELSAQKWLSEQKEAIAGEVSRLQSIYLLQEACRLTNTKALSDKKSALAEELVTGAFTRRFEKELKALGASRIRVKIEKTKTTKGQAWHQIKLIENKVPVKTADVLSEGEFRIVSIAAFLADVDAKAVSTPFVFDDPISSLDQDFEELTACRLVELCKTRQVIIFTHRLSLMAMLENAADKAGVVPHVISLQRESWGAGEPSDPPLPTQKPKAALNTLIGQRLPKAKEVWQAQGSAAYSVEAKALCSDVRMTIERLIEWDLLADVVQRFRRPIKTLGKIEKLAKIKAGDCAFLDGMMTKYSRYEHAQPDEAPVPLPEPDELAEDLEKLKTWQDEFTTRAVPAP